jgi:hypothetical protein
MPIDFYIKSIDEPNYSEETLLETEDLALIIAQIKMVLLTKNDSVLGENRFGIDEETYLFDFSDSFSTTKIHDDIVSQLKLYCTLLQNRDWNVEVLKVNDGIDQFRDSIHVVISIDKSIRFVIAYQ